MLRFVGLQTRYSVLKIYPTAFRIEVTIVSRSEYYTTGKGMGSRTEGRGGAGREGRMTVLVVERNTEC
jgi:hypothetical protein